MVPDLSNGDYLSVALEIFHACPRTQNRHLQEVLNVNIIQSDPNDQPYTNEGYILFPDY